MRVAMLVLLLGCRSSEPKPKPAPLRDAAVKLQPDAAPDAGIARLAVPLPVAKIDGKYYYPLGAHLPDAQPDVRTWSAVEMADGVRPAPKAVPPWSLLVGQTLDAYSVTGTACRVRVAEVALLDRMSAEDPRVLGRVEPIESCVPWLVSDKPPAILALADVPKPELKTVEALFHKEPTYVTYKEDASQIGRGQKWASAIQNDARRFIVLGESVQRPSDCGTKTASVIGMYEIRNGAPALVAIEEGELDKPDHAIDWDRDGQPELVYDEGDTLDLGMRGAKRYARIWSPSGVISEIALSYYMGCD